MALGQTARPAPEQPIPYSHRLHAGQLKIPCNTCHPNPDPGEMMTIPQAGKCMSCHSSIKTDSPAIQRLAAFAKNDRQLPWVRVYSIPSYVYFSHRIHLKAGSACANCHGDVAASERVSREGDISMGECMNCHREQKASIDCSFCHEAMQQ